jgi:(4-(4-[2-(gamma-L-glutamylamino)ethyl]phenoxymethyl)furan-2-yl)methanamine synthase
MPNILALDIGGANIKVADGRGYVRSWPFALWKSPEQLADKLAECLAAAPLAEQIVVTMTGELCDCYQTKREGVRSIVTATLEAIRNTPVTFYQTTGQFVAADKAIANHLLTAASNWHALATFAARYCEGRPGMLIDIGSTTTDMIPIENGGEAARGRTDPERLAFRELVYTGVERTPACAVVTHVPWLGAACPVAQEFFATSGDAYLLLEELAEDPASTNTADGQAFIRTAAHNRLARLVCGDGELVPRKSTRLFAEEIKSQQLGMLQRAYTTITYGMNKYPEMHILSGQGEFLAREFCREYLQLIEPPISLTQRLGPEVSRCATAHALAALAQEQL